MVVPPRPTARLRVGQAGLALAPLQALLDAVLRVGDAGELRQGDHARCLRQSNYMELQKEFGDRVIDPPSSPNPVPGKSAA